MLKDDLGDPTIAGRIGMAIDLEEQALTLTRAGLKMGREVQIWNSRFIERGEERRDSRGRRLVEQRQIYLLLGWHQQYKELTTALLCKSACLFDGLENQPKVRVIRLRQTLIAGIKGGCELKLTAIGKIDGPATELRSQASSRVLQ